ncbi:MAG: hypothetical protein IKU47_03525 [Oscillospiraceae bacterium]|nr:hypothetical protein [Oscillospiraceae bacterium]
MKEQIYRIATLICVIGIIATTGGFEWSMFGIGRWLMQTALFMAGVVVFHNAAERQYRATRRRKAVK